MRNQLKSLSALKNVGPAALKDFAILGIQTVEQLANQNADDLYLRLQQLTQTKHDPCVWDVFAATIHEAKTGEKTPWWQWTKMRKARQQQGIFVKEYK